MPRTNPLIRAWLLALATPVLVLAFLSILTSLALAGTNLSFPTPRIEEAKDGMFGPFFEKLRKLESSGEGRICILQIGDSLTAGDFFTHRLRTLLQRRFQNAGVGWLPPGNVTPHTRSSQAEILNTENWEMFNSFSQGDRIYSIGGFAALSEEPEESITYRVKQNDASGEIPSRLQVFVLCKGGSGPLKVEVDGETKRIIDCGNKGLGMWSVLVDLDRWPSEVTLESTKSSPVEVFGVTLERKTPGIVLDSVGIGGAQVNIIRNWHPLLIKEQVRLRNPSLLILQFGTNEGFNGRLSAARYEQDYRAAIDALRSAAPGVPVLAIGPPDGQRLPKHCRKAKKVRVKGRWIYKRPDLTKFSCRKNIDPKAAESECVWSIPENLGVVRDIQHKTALAMGCGFWDWSHVMGGGCGMEAWVKEGLGGSDHVHFTVQGYFKSADLLFEALMDKYAAYLRSSGKETITP